MTNAVQTLIQKQMEKYETITNTLKNFEALGDKITKSQVQTRLNFKSHL